MRPLLDIHHLEMMIAIDETESLAEAAHFVGVTPSALSHRVREAERRLDVILFRKHGRQLRATPAAELLTGEARLILQHLWHAETLAIGAGAGARHLVRLTVGTYNSFHWLPDFLTAFRDKHADIDVDILANAVQRPYDHLANGTLDVAITPDTVIPGGIRSVPLFDDQLVAVMPHDNPITQNSYVSAEDLVDETILTYSFASIPGYEGERFWSPSHVIPRRSMRIESIEAIVELVKAGFGISILSQWAMEPIVKNSQLTMSRLGPDGLDITWNAVVRYGVSEDGPAMALVNALQSWFAAQPAIRPPSLS